MGLEVSTYISGLTASWPVSGDQKSQGDDHLRLLKSVLQSTFPVASKPFYFPTTEAVSGTITLDATDQNNIVEVTTTGGNVTVNLPSTLGVGDKGWTCQVVKVSSDVNAAIVTPAAGTIASKVGATATIRVGLLCEPATFVWNGTGWRCSKPGPMIGSTENYDGATVPYGYLFADGAAYSTTNFAELFAVLASGVVKDKRGRIEAGPDVGTGRLSSTYFGAVAVLGAVGGAESRVLTLGQIPAGITSRNAAQAINVTTAQKVVNGPNQGSSPGGGTQVTASDAGSGGALSLLGSSGANDITVTSNNTGGAAVATVQPTIVVNKIIRAC